MAMGPERSKPLHNFTLPCELKWGNRKFLRCVKLDSNGEMSDVHRRPNGLSDPPTGRKRVAPSSGRSHERLKKEAVGSSRRFESDADDGIASVREKLMFDLQTAADKMKDAILREGLKEELHRTAAEEAEEELSPALAPPESAPADPNKPWSLRTRRTTVGSTQSLNISPLRAENKSPTLQNVQPVVVGQQREKAKLSVPLARREIEEDFMAIVGHRPARRPRKRSKLVQKNLDTLFPGLWLSEITVDLYKVPDDQ
ncbi:unnamed protein product [Cuscuta epithymum]|uniref:DUF1639 family protein n=1 Tax=Cuscuta epithymum TaxID=186058 RepID=A0AAV0FWY6_9ASTE|nr:unnamed protein product [Cuscuta epithymum]CAH9139893.1 unnamed protein product [Cuscuta epithymum]